MAVRMTSLRRLPNGDWFSRKEIPKDIRAAYKLAHGLTHEERFRRPANLSLERAKAELRDWDAVVSSRIDGLRAASRGEGRDLTQRQAAALTHDWYLWFTQPHEEEPGQPWHWDLANEMLETALALPSGRRQARISELARVPSFLAERREVLSSAALGLFVDGVAEEFPAACALLRRRAGGDFGRDTRRDRIAAIPPSAGMSCWELFEAWVKERQPAASTVDRWRSVFRTLNDHIQVRDIATLSDIDAIAWKDTLVTPERSPRVVNEVWLTAARTVFAWAVTNKKIKVNPFKGVSVATRRKPVKHRSPEYTDAELATILTASLAPPPKRLALHHAAARRWVPWIAAYTGSRPGEITQLRAQDFVNEQGMWAIKITPEAGTVKGGAARTVPLHEHLIEQGLIEFAKGNSGPLFYDPKAARAVSNDPTKPRKGQWTKTRDKLAEWIRSLDIKDAGLSPNHAFRHSFKRRASRAGIEAGIRDAICGHASRSIADHYETPSLEDMATALAKFPRYPFDTQTPS